MVPGLSMTEPAACIFSVEVPWLGIAQFDKRAADPPSSPRQSVEVDQ